jgi:hypothetical protein
MQGVATQAKSGDIVEERQRRIFPCGARNAAYGTFTTGG